MERAPRRLPIHFVRPHRLPCEQLELFVQPLSRWLVRSGIAPHEARFWYESGWLSFDPSEAGGWSVFGDARQSELLRVRDLLRSAGGYEQSRALLGVATRRPLADLDRLAWSMKYGWVEPAPQPAAFDVTSVSLVAYMEHLSRTGDLAKLLGIRNHAERLLSKVTH